MDQRRDMMFVGDDDLNQIRVYGSRRVDERSWSTGIHKKYIFAGNDVEMQEGP